MGDRLILTLLLAEPGRRGGPHSPIPIFRVWARVCLRIKARSLGQGCIRPVGRAPGRPSPRAAGRHLVFSKWGIRNTLLFVASPEQANSHSSGVVYHGKKEYNLPPIQLSLPKYFRNTSPHRDCFIRAFLGLKQAIFSLFCSLSDSFTHPTPYILVNIFHRFALICRRSKIRVKSNWWKKQCLSPGTKV